MKSRILLNLALAAAVAALGLFAFLKPRPGTGPEYRLSGLNPSEVTEFRVERAGLPALEIRKRSGRWTMTAPIPGRVELLKVQRVLDLTGATSRQRFAADDLQRFELAPPALVITLQGERFALGMRNPVSQEQYVGTRDGVFLVAPRFAAAVPARAEDWLSRQPLADPESPVAFEMPGFTIRSVDGKWTVSPERSDLSQDDLNRWVQEWRSARAGAVERGPKTPQGESFTLRLKDDRAVPFRILRREPEVVLVRTDENLQYHFSRENGAPLLNLPAREKR
ncbi:MAG: DUF4340 domain-containing protein [Betaproteobacteria bacterium]|nr:DUF4340 domain-containing protein [Betaproteobacteria bacterium]